MNKAVSSSNFFADRLPSNWEWLPIKYGFDLIGSGTTPPTGEDDYYGDYLPWVTTSELRENVITSTEKSVSESAVRDFTALKIYPPNTVLIAMYGATIGRVGILGIKACVNQAVCALANPTRFEHRFVSYSLQSARNHLIGLASGGGQPNLNAEKIVSLKLPCPPLSRQRAIADYLDRETARLDALIAAKERLLELLAEKRRAVITHAVTRGLNSDVSLRDSGVEWLDKIPIHWTGTVLKRWVETKITDGPHETPEHVEDGIPFVSAEAVQRGSINFDSRWGNISRELHERYSKKLLPKRNDIFLVKSGATTGKVAFVDIDMEFNVWSPLALIRANTKMVLPKFLFVIMQSDYVQKQIQMTWTAGTQPNISMGTIEELYVVAPPVEEQEFVLERLYNQLKNIDRLTVLAQKTIENLYERRASLIASVVSGQLQIAVKM